MAARSGSRLDDNTLFPFAQWSPGAICFFHRDRQASWCCDGKFVCEPCADSIGRHRKPILPPLRVVGGDPGLIEKYSLDMMELPTGGYTRRSDY